MISWARSTLQITTFVRLCVCMRQRFIFSPLCCAASHATPACFALVDYKPFVQITALVVLSPVQTATLGDPVVTTPGLA